MAYGKKGEKAKNTGEESLQENGREEEKKKDGDAASVRVNAYVNKYINFLGPSSFCSTRNDTKACEQCSAQL